MMAPGLLQNPLVKNWLGGVEPVWTLLDFESFAALHYPPSPVDGPIKIAADLSTDEIQMSPIAGNAMHFLRAAGSGPGLKLTATGNLSRAVVEEMIVQSVWPDFDKASVLKYSKVINEPDVTPLHLVRHLVEVSGLVRRQKGYLRITPAGRRMVSESNKSALLAALFHIALWRVDLSVLGRGLLQGWPQRDIGIVLWSLSMVANDWQSPDRLSRLCTFPINAVVESQWDIASLALEATILRTLYWFGIIERRDETIPGSHFEHKYLYRKSALFDRLLTFDVKLQTDSALRH